MHWLVIPGSLIAGLFGGAGWSALWELWLRPRRDRVSIARALTAEIDGNVAIASSLLKTWDKTQPVPSMLRFSTLIFSSVAPKIGAIEVSVLPDLVRLYRSFDNLSEYSGISARIEEPGGWQGVQHIQNRRELADVFSNALQEMLSASMKVREALEKSAAGWRASLPNQSQSVTLGNSEAGGV
jgi:hypothetical protein